MFPNIYANFFHCHCHLVVMLNLPTTTARYFVPTLSSFRYLRSIPADRLKRLIAEESKSLGQRIVPGRDQPSSWWLPQPRDPTKKVVGLRPVKPLPELRISMVREGCTNRPFYTIQVETLSCYAPYLKTSQITKIILRTIELSFDRIQYHGKPRVGGKCVTT